MNLLDRLIAAVAKGYDCTPGDSDLDDEQPIWVRLTLGEYRTAQYFARNTAALDRAKNHWLTIAQSELKDYAERHDREFSDDAAQELADLLRDVTMDFCGDHSREPLGEADKRHQSWLNHMAERGDREYLYGEDA